MNEYNFGPACEGEEWVFGCGAPTYSLDNVDEATVDAWMAFIKGQGIERAVCLLGEEQLSKFSIEGRELLARLGDELGADQVLHAPIDDFQLIGLDDLEHVAHYLEAGAEARRKSLVFCLGGVGRTGHVLAGWLAFSRDLPPEEAIAAVRVFGVYRDAGEAAARSGQSETLNALLEGIRTRRKSVSP